MATVQETATQIASIIARLDAGTITEAQAATELNAALADFPPVASIQDLTAKVIAMIGRMDGTLIVSGVPSPSVGTIGSIAIDLTNKQVYGPKTVTGWGSPTPLVGAQGNTGPAGTITDITVATGAAGSNASIVVGGTPSARTMALTVPRGNKGDTGPSPVLSIASVTTGAPGSDANITQGGTALAPTYAFVIPRGATGDKGDTGAVPNVTAQIAMIAHGGVASVTRSGPDTAPVLTFNIPAPLDGVDAKQVEFNKSATHIQWRRIGEAAWLDLVALSDLMVKGDKGDAFEFGAKPADLAARAVYDAEPEGFTVLVMDTGMVYARIGATAGVWSDGFPFGQTQNAILEALSQLNATEGVLVQTGPDTFAKRAIGVGTGASLPDRDAADSRYRQIGAAVPLADITGLVAALDEKADAGAVLAALSGKQAALGFTPEDVSKKGVANGYAGLGEDGKVPSGQLDIASTTPAELRAGTDDKKFATAKALADARLFVDLVDGATIPVNFAAGDNFKVTLGGNRTFGAPTNVREGKSGFLRITQGAGGGQVPAFHSTYRLPKNGLFFDPTPDAVTYVPYIGEAGGIVQLMPSNAAKPKTYAEFLAQVDVLATSGAYPWSNASGVSTAAFKTTVAASSGAMSGSPWLSAFASSAISRIVQHCLPSSAVFAAITGTVVCVKMVSAGSQNTPALDRNGFLSSAGGVVTAATVSDAYYFDPILGPMKVQPSLGLGPTPYSW